MSELKGILDAAVGNSIISKQEFDYLLPTNPVMSTFYGLPKVHKGTNSLKGRRIVSGVDNLTQKAGIYIDKVLRSFATTLPSYTMDTADLLLKLEGISVDDNTILASIDVEALYSSIPHQKGYRAVGHFLAMRGVQYGLRNDFVLRLLSFIFPFIFMAKYTSCTAMVSPCTPTYANLLLGGGKIPWFLRKRQRGLTTLLSCGPVLSTMFTFCGKGITIHSKYSSNGLM